MKFRYDINALRAIAVLGVIFYHFKIPYFSGGFSGVDVFFVISGYLMSRIIISSIDKNVFSFQEFYGKRIKRIVPALLFLVFIITLLGFFFYFPKDYMINEKNAASSVLFLSNFFYWKTSNYFTEASNNILIHTWSLSVEWQFYLLYPVILYYFNKIVKSKKKYTLFFTITTVIIFLCSIAYSAHHNNAAFYLLPSRSWEMMIGGIAFLSESFITEFRYKKIGAFLGYGLILLCFLLLDSNRLWPGVYTLIPVLATFLVMVSNANSFKILKYKVVQFIGNISYSLYLWHWPVYVTALYLGIEMTIVNITVMVLVSILLAYISYRYIESIQFNTDKGMKLALALMVLLVAITATIGYVDLNHIMFKPKALKIANYKTDHEDEIRKQYREDVCFITFKTGFKGFNKTICLGSKAGKKNILLIGDSHAAHLYQSLQESLEKNNINITQATVAGCYPVSEPEGSQPCQDLMGYMYNDFIKYNPNKIDGVIISCNWIEHISCKNDKDWELLKSTINYFTRKNIKIILIGQSERYNVPYAFIKAKEEQFNINIRQQYIFKQGYSVNLFLKKNLEPYYVDIYNEGPIIPPLSPNDVPYMFDESHFTKYGADLTVQKIFANHLAKKFISSITN